MTFDEFWATVRVALPDDYPEPSAGALHAVARLSWELATATAAEARRRDVESQKAIEDTK